MAQMVKHLSTMQETQVQFLGREDPWRRKWQSTPVLLPGKPHGWRSLVAYSPWGRKESDTTERLHFHFSLSWEKEMATHSSFLAWRTPGTEEPGGLPSMGSHSQTRLNRLSSSSSSNEIAFKTDLLQNEKQS